jgi:hypothetical protein
VSEHRDPCHLSAPAGVQPSPDLVVSPWWINPVKPGARRARRIDQEFAAIAGQLCLAAWMIGLLIESSCVLVGPPRPAVAAVVGTTTASQSAPSLGAAPVTVAAPPPVVRASTLARP